MLNMHGHKLTKAGNGRILMKDGRTTEPGEIEFVAPSGLWMQDNFDLGESDTAALKLTGGAGLTLASIFNQRRPLWINGLSSMQAGSASADVPTRDDYSVNVWEGPLWFTDGSRLSANVSREDRITFGGQISGAGSINLSFEAGGLLEITNENNRATWTGTMGFDGARGGRIMAAYPTSVPPANLVTGSYSRLIAKMPNWSRKDVLDYANNATLSGNAFISADTSDCEGTPNFALANSDVTGDDFGIAHDGTNIMVLAIMGPISKAVGLAGFGGVMKVTGDGTLLVSRILATSDGAALTGKVLFDGASDIRLKTNSHVYIGANENGRAGATCRGEVEVRNSSLVIDDLTKEPAFTIGYYAPGVLRVGEGAVITSSFQIARGAANNGHGAIYQTGGELVRHKTNANTYDGIGGSGCVGYHELRGGRAVYAGVPRLGQGGPALISISGGEMSVGDYYPGNWQLGYYYGAALYISGGSFTSYSRLYVGGNQPNMTGSCQLTVDGEGAYVRAGVDNICYIGAGSRAERPLESTLNLNRGVFCADSVGRYPGDSYTNDAVQRAYINFNGGTFRTMKSNWAFGGNPGSYPTRANRVTVFQGGAVIDTYGNNVSILPPFEKPEGNGVVSVPVPEEILSAGLVAPPHVEIFDPSGEGQGASAVAEFDSDAGVVRRVIVTSPGWNYTSAKAIFTYGSHKFCTNDCVIAANSMNGGLVKTGAGTLTLHGANTYGGDTVIREGTLTLGASGSLPEGTTVRLEGGTLNLNGKTVDVSRVTGNAGAIVGGCVELPGLTVDLAEATAGKFTTYDCDVSFAEGAVITVLNGELAQAEDFRKCVLVKFNGEVEGMPTVVAGVEGLDTGKLRLTNRGGTIRLAKQIGLTVILR